MPHDQAPSAPELYKEIGRRRLQSEEPRYRAKKEAAERAREALNTAPEDQHEQAQLNFDIANAELEKFDLTHDVTGAWRGDRFGQDLEQPFQQMFSGEQGEHVIPPENQYLFLVYMGELDRMNKEGGHGGGDKALELTVVGVEQALKKHLTQPPSGDWGEAFDIYRLSGTEFSVRIKSALTAEQATAIRGALKQDTAFSKKEFNPAAETDPESPPLCVRSVSLEQVRHAMPEKSVNSEKPEREAISTARDLLYTLIEEEKFVTRVERLQEKLQTNGPESAKAFYENYLKKYLAGPQFKFDHEKVEITNFEQAQQVVGAMPKDSLQRWKFLHQPAFESSIELLHRQYETRSGTIESVAKASLDIVRSEFEAEKQRHSEKDGGEFSVSDEIFQPRISDLLIEKIPKAEAKPFAYPDPKTATRGLRHMNQLVAEQAEAYKTFQGDPTNQKKVAEFRRKGLQLDIEFAKRDRATGLQLKAQLYRESQEAFAAGKSVANIGIDLGFLKYFDKVGGTKTGDLAILKCAELFDLACCGKPDGPGIFDGEDFKDREVKAEPFRPGGDEFNIIVTGRFADRPELLNKAISEMKIWILQQAQETGEIPAEDGAKPEYQPTQLAIGLGNEAFASYEAGLKACEDYGISLDISQDLEPGTEDETKRNKLTEHLLNIADHALEIQKSYQRIQYLGKLGKNLVRLAKMAETAPSPQASEQLVAAKKQYQGLLIYSQKTLGEGADAQLEGITGIKLGPIIEGQGPPELEIDLKKDTTLNVEHDRQENEAILTFILERANRDIAGKREEGKEAAARIELVAQIQFLEHYQRELEAHIAELGSENQSQAAKLAERENVIALRDKTIQSLQQEKSAISSLRGGIQGM